MGFNKKFFTTGGIVASTPSAAAFDPLQNFETVTYTGNGGTQKITGYIRKGAAFNGSSSYIDLDGTLANGNTGDFSISMWVNIPNSSSQYRLFATDISPYYSKLNVNIETNGKLRAAFGNGTNAEAVVYTTSTNWANGSWHHLVYTMNWNGSYFDIKFYQNGSLDSSHTTSGTSVVVLSNSKLILGGLYRQDNTTYYPTYLGKQDQVRIFNTALDSGEVTTLYNEDYDSSTKSTTDIFGDGSGVALYELDENANDTGTVASTVDTVDIFGDGSIDDYYKLDGVFTNEVIGGTSLQSGSSTFGDGILGQALYLSGAQTASQTSTSYGSMNITGSYSISFYFKATVGSKRNLIWYHGNNNGYNNQIELSSDNRLYFGAGTITSQTYSANAWYHIAASFNSSNGLITAYVNGQPIGTRTAPTVGADSNQCFGHGSVGLTGYIDQVRIFNKIISDSDAATLYEVTSHNGTPTNVNFLGMAFQPDLVWVKARTSPYSHNLQDSVRGGGQSTALNPNLTLAEGTYGIYGFIDTFDTNGFTTGTGSTNNVHVNQSGVDYVAWCWKAADAAVSGTSSHYTNCEISANPDAGFSMVKFTVPSGTIPTTASYNHGLNAAPKLIITKPYNGYFGASSWYTWAEPITTSNYLLLNTSDASAAGAIFSSVDSSTVKYRFASNNGGAASDVITYNFTDVDGYQRIGSYQGSGSSGKRVYTTDDGTSTGIGGFQPRFVLIKRATGGAGEWLLYDSMRETTSIKQDTLAADSDRAENTNVNYEVEFESNGFSLDGTSAGINGLNDTYIYLAIA